MMAIATRGSRRTLRSFCRPLAELKMTCSPSVSHQTGVVCGLPSGLRVVRLANTFLLNRSRNCCGITSGIFTFLRCLNRSWNYRRVARVCAAYAMPTQHCESIVACCSSDMVEFPAKFMPEAERQHRFRIMLAFGLVYFFWGSTYLGIRIAV